MSIVFNGNKRKTVPLVHFHSICIGPSGGSSWCFASNGNVTANIAGCLTMQNGIQSHLFEWVAVFCRCRYCFRPSVATSPDSLSIVIVHFISVRNLRVLSSSAFWLSAPSPPPPPPPLHSFRAHFCRSDCTSVRAMMEVGVDTYSSGIYPFHFIYFPLLAFSWLRRRIPFAHVQLQFVRASRLRSGSAIQDLCDNVCALMQW